MTYADFFVLIPLIFYPLMGLVVLVLFFVRKKRVPDFVSLINILFAIWLLVVAMISLLNTKSIFGTYFYDASDYVQYLVVLVIILLTVFKKIRTSVFSIVGFSLLLGLTFFIVNQFFPIHSV